MDLWQLGVCIFAMVEGKYPWDPTDVPQMVWDQEEGAIPFRLVCPLPPSRISSSSQMAPLKAKAGARHFIRSLLRPAPCERMGLDAASEHAFLADPAAFYQD